MSRHSLSKLLVVSCVYLGVVLSPRAVGQEDEKLLIGPNVNMVSGTELPARCRGE